MITFEMFAPLFQVLGVLLIVVIVLTLLKSKKKKHKKVKLEYSKQKSLLTNNELNFYRSLKPIADKHNYILMSKVRMADVIEPKKGTKNYMSLFARISQKHVDFLLCNIRTLEPLLAIELDDKSHDNQDRQNRDKFIDEAYRLAKLPILHTRTSENLESQVLKSLV